MKLTFLVYLCKILNLSVFEMWIVADQKELFHQRQRAQRKKESKIRLFMIEAKYGNRHRNRTISINYEYWWWCRLIINSNVCVWNVFVIFVHMHGWSGESVRCALPYNKPNGYAIVTNVQFIEMTKLLLLLLLSHCWCLKLIYLKLRRHILFCVLSQSYLIVISFSRRVLPSFLSSSYWCAASFRSHSSIPLNNVL